MIEGLQKRTWQEFKDIGLLWWINRALHLFGWVIVCELDENSVLVSAYPARTTWRGFERADEEKGFRALSQYLEENVKEINEEAKL